MDKGSSMTFEVVMLAVSFFLLGLALGGLGVALILR